MVSWYRLIVVRDGVIERTILDTHNRSDALFFFRDHATRSTLTYPQQLILKRNGRTVSVYQPERNP